MSHDIHNPKGALIHSSCSVVYLLHAAYNRTRLNIEKAHRSPLKNKYRNRVRIPVNKVNNPRYKLTN